MMSSHHSGVSRGKSNLSKLPKIFETILSFVNINRVPRKRNGHTCSIYKNYSYNNKKDKVVLLILFL